MMRSRTAKRGNTKPDHISDEDMQRHERMLTKLDEAQQLQTQAQQLQGRALELVSAFKIWSEELHARYQLAVDGTEGVNTDGSISRST